MSNKSKKSKVSNKSKKSKVSNKSKKSKVSNKSKKSKVSNKSKKSKVSNKSKKSKSKKVSKRLKKSKVPIVPIVPIVQEEPYSPTSPRYVPSTPYYSEAESNLSIDNGILYDVIDKNVTSITIPDNIVSITMFAFTECIALIEINIPENVTFIGRGAFKRCSSLTTVTFAENSKLRTIGEYAFQECLVQNINIPKGVRGIGEGAFYECYYLIEINIPESVEFIGDHAFNDCRSLKNINIPEGVTIIGEYTFSNCESLEKVTFTEISKLITIEEGAFGACSSLIEITIPESVEIIKDEAFAFCNTLEKVLFEPNSKLKQISESCFRQCDNLIIENIIFPNNITFGFNEYCANLKNMINQPQDKPDISINDDDVYHDVIDMEDYKVKDFIKNNTEENLIIIKINNFFYIADKNRFIGYDNITDPRIPDNKRKFYPCRLADSRIGPNNLCKYYRELVFINLRDFSSQGFGYYKDFVDKENKYFVAYKINVVIPSFVSSDNLRNVEGSRVGGAHCQEGQGVDYIYRFYPVSDQELQEVLS